MTGAVDARAERWVLIASNASVAVALALIAGKSVAWYLTQSASLLGSLLDSVMDSMASVLTLLAVRYSLKPADADHRFGHGKAESLAALAQAGFIMASALFLLVYCVRRSLGAGADGPAHTAAGLAVSLFAIVCTLALVAVQSHAVRLSGSAAIRADSLHYRSDLMLNLSVIAALGGTAIGYPRLDALTGIGIALYIAHGAWHIGWVAFDTLMDRELPPEVDQAIVALALQHEGVLGVHDLRTRQSGMRYHIQLHLEFDDETPLLRAHDIADAVETALRARFPGADVLIHQDPCSAVLAERRGTSGRSGARDVADAGRGPAIGV
jgi:ferrous-iron efflux pump FieF